MFSWILDVIGCLHEVIKMQTASNGRKACANIVLSDGCGNIIDCTLWENHASKIIDHVNSNNGVGTTVLVITHAWCKPKPGIT